VYLDGGTAVVTGIAKGAGMIRPGMATMLGFVATDARVSQGALQHLIADAAAGSFTASPSTAIPRRTLLRPDRDRRRRRLYDRRPATPDSRHCAKPCSSYRRGSRSDRARRRGRDEVHHRAREKGGTETECASVAYAIAHSPL